MSLLKRSLFFALLVCVGCSAQSSSPADTNKRIEDHVRAHFSVPSSVQIRVGDRKPSEFSGYDQVTVTFTQGERKQPFDFLVSKDNKTLIRMTKIDITEDLEAKAKREAAEAMAKIDLKNRPWMGSKDAKVTIVNYDDFQCPFCSRMHQALVNDVMKSYGDRVKLVYKDFPLTAIHPWATRASVNANCLATQSNDSYWAYANAVHARAPEISANRSRGLTDQFGQLDSLALEQGRQYKVDEAKLQACINKQDESAVKASMAEAESLGVQATPTLFVNGVRLEGALPPSELRAAIDKALQDAGQGHGSTK